MFVAHSFRTHSSRLRQIACSVAASDSAQTWHPTQGEHSCSSRKFWGSPPLAQLLALAAPAERANALSLSNPGAAAAVQEDARLATTEVHWRHIAITTITVGIAGTIATTTIIMAIIATGTAGERDSLAQRSSRPVHCGPVSI